MAYSPGSIPPDEALRLKELEATGVLDTAPEPAFDELVELASELCGTPIALVSLVDADRQWFKARVGLDAGETPRDVSFCGHVVGNDAMLLVPDAQRDPRFADNPLVTGSPKVRFYAGCPLRTEAGHVLGTLCVIDHQPNMISEKQRRQLEVLARQVADQLKMRRIIRELEVRNRLLAQSCEELEQYAHVISHDLKEPLRAIRSYVKIFREDFAGGFGEQEQRYLEFIENGSNRLHSMVGDLLAFSRAGGEGLDFEAVCLNQTLDDVLEGLAPRIAESGAEVVVNPLPEVAGLPTQLHQVFQNLISNGIKFSNAGSRKVSIGATEHPEYWEVSVQDNGVGMDPKHFDRVFQVFQRLHHAAEYEGNGIGLAITKKVMEAHGGKVWIASQPGEGCTVFLRFPRSVHRPAPPAMDRHGRPVSA